MINQKEDVIRVFDNLALEYSWERLYSGKVDRLSYNFVIRQRIVKELLEPYVSGKALDVGCGSGDLVMFYARKGIVYTGVDLSSSMIKRANSNYEDLVRKGKATFQVADCEHLPFGKGEFDVLSAVALIEYLPDPSKALCEMARVVKTGGYILITVPNKRCINTRIRGFFKPITGIFFPLYIKLRRASLAAMKDVKHYNYTQKEIDQLMEKMCLSKIGCRYANFHIIPHPLDHLMPKIYMRISEAIVRRKLDKVFKDWASNYIAIYKKC